MKMNRIMRNRVMIGCLMLAMAGVAAIIITFAWYASMGDNEVNNIKMSSVNMPFSLRTAEQETPTYWSAYKALFQKADASYLDGTSETVSMTTYYKTDANNDSIIWRLETTETTAEGNIYTIGLNPGSSGTLNFEIIPKVSGNLAVDFNFNLRGFTGIFPTQQQIDGGMEPDTLLGLAEVNSSSAQEEKDALKYIGGHILFFKTKVTQGGNDVYSDFLGDSYHFQTNSAVKNTAIPVTVYWIWVNTIDQIILKSGDGDNTPIIADNNDTDRASLLTYLKNNRNNIFEAISSYDVGTYVFDDKLAALTYASYKAEEKTRNCMDESYNSADQTIGMNLGYVMIEMNAQVGSVIAGN